MIDRDEEGGPRRRPSTIYSCRIRLQQRDGNGIPARLRQYCLQRRDARAVISGITLGDCLRRRTRCVRPGKCATARGNPVARGASPLETTVM